MPHKNIVIFGAGKIGRSFIGQLFGQAAYQVIFVDTNAKLVHLLNERASYPLIVKGPDREERLVVEGVSAIDAKEKALVKLAIVEADIMAICVGKSALAAVSSSLVEGLLLREKTNPGQKVDIILAENMRSANLFFENELKNHLPSSYPLKNLVGFVETSIGKMVPIMTSADLEEDPLQVFAEPYNTLILDKKGFRGKIPEIKGLSLKDNMKAWVDRKAFIHNLGHATAAYAGYLRNPEHIFMFEVLSNVEVYDFTRKVMMEAAAVLLSVYPNEFTKEDLEIHIDDLLNRFRNRNLRDTVFRVGSDLKRKLGPDDRFLGIIRLARKYELAYDLILEAMAMGFSFRGRNEQDELFPGDAAFHHLWSQDPDQLLELYCGLHLPEDALLIKALKAHILRIEKTQ